MNVVITGATGFVGSSLARALAASGATIRALARPFSDRSRLADLPLTWLEGDITDPESLRGKFEGADWIVHAAGMLGQAGIPEAAYQRVHADGTRNALTEAAASGSPKVLYVSSPGVLGPIDGEPADETAPLAPSNPYERSKAVAEEIARGFAQDGLPVVIVRPEFMYGPGDTHVLGLFRAVQRGIFFYVGSDLNTCHPTFIEDAVAGMLACIQKGQPGETYHITGPRPVTFCEFGETIARALNVRAPWLAVPHPVAWVGAVGLELVGNILGKTPPLSRTGVAFFSENRRFSWQKARQELGFTPGVDLEEGVERTVSWYRQHGHL